MSERTVQRTSPPELANLPASFWDDAVLVTPVAKQPISLRVDVDILAWFKKQGPGYQSRINAVLRAYMSASRTARQKPPR
ncbi:MAG: BrnA antitoxin family protein [Candidatus Binatia bacterium]